MSNRVEDLERQVQELQAAVNGLTEELVETKARLRDLEKVEAEEPSPPEEPSEVPRERTTKSDVHADVVEVNPDAKRSTESSPEDGTDRAEGTESTDGAETADDAAEADGSAEAPKSEETDESTGDGESEESDIIVA